MPEKTLILTKIHKEISANIQHARKKERLIRYAMSLCRSPDIENNRRIDNINRHNISSSL